MRPHLYHSHHFYTRCPCRHNPPNLSGLGTGTKYAGLHTRWLDHRISPGVKEGPADCIRIDEVAAALKKMKRHKVPGLSRLVAEMIQATQDTETQSLLDLCNGIVKEGCIQEDWKSSVILPIYKVKGDPEEINCWNML